MKINEPCKKDVDAICKLLYLISQLHDKNFLYINGSSTIVSHLTEQRSQPNLELFWFLLACVVVVK